jgi:hypothetical protein
MVPRTQRTHVTILYEPFTWPLSPYGIYELSLTSAGLLPSRELARARTREEALRLIQRMGWEY